MARFKVPKVTRKGGILGVAVAAIAMLLGVAADAQRAGNWGGFDRGSSQNSRQSKTYEAGKFDYYVLSMSWSPSYCASAAASSRDNQQCAPRGGKKFSFVLHGLWPQFERGWPQDCKTADNGFVPRPVANRMLDIMPSDKLIFHEYRKHGTCSGLGVDAYFDLSRKLYGQVKIPQRYQDVTDPRLTVAPTELVSEFVAANPGLTRDMIVVKCGQPGNRLEEVRVCFDRDGKFRACGKNEDQRKACSAPRMYVPPVRG
jgi:ribonuclease T2